MIDDHEVVRLMKANRENKRGHADYFAWGLDRDLEEAYVVNELLQSLEQEKINDLECITIRGRGNDPPDCEAIDASSNRVAVEVTEFVDSDAIRESKKNRFDIRELAWSKEEFLKELTRLVEEKAARKSKLKGYPYPGGYRVVVYCSESELNQSNVSEFLVGSNFAVMGDIDHAYFLLSCDPVMGHCPVFKLKIS